MEFKTVKEFIIESDKIYLVKNPETSELCIFATKSPINNSDKIVCDDIKSFDSDGKSIISLFNWDFKTTYINNAERKFIIKEISPETDPEYFI